MSRFSDPVTAIDFLAESEHVATRSPDKLNYLDLATKLDIAESTVWRIRKRKTRALPIVAKKLKELAEAEARRRREVKRQRSATA